MTNSQGHSPKDYSLLLDNNFNSLNNRPSFDAKLLLDENLDWYLLEYLKEMELMGSCNEQTLNALLTLIGGLSNNSFCRNLFNGTPVWLNIFSHVLGTTGSNKSFLANEIMHALKTIDDKYPNIYSNRKLMNDVDVLEEQPNKKQKLESWNFLASTITEAALSKNTNYTDVMIVNPDGDNALKNLSYYEQNSMSGAPGVSSFCNGFDGIEPGSSRITGVELLKNDRQRPSKLSMYLVSTGKKLSIPIMKMLEEGANDGIYGRVWYTHTNTVRELPDVLTQKQTSLPNFTHIALSCHNFFQNRIVEFRYGLHRSDFSSRPRGLISDRMQEARRAQNVNLPEFYGTHMDENDIVPLQARSSDHTKDDSTEEISPFELATRFTNDVWNESFTLEKHIGEMWRKIPYHLPKAIATIKVLRVLFRIMGEHMLYYMNSQEGNRSYKLKLIPEVFYQKLNEALNDYFAKSTRTIEVENKMINIVLLTSDDVEAGYLWCRRKLATTQTLFSTTQLQHIVNTRTNKVSTQTASSSTKSIVQRRMDNAMVKVLMTPTIFFTNGYLSMNTLRGGSGLFMQKKVNDLKYDVVVENLLAKGYLVKCDAIENARPPKNNNLSSSYYKQQPSYFEQSQLRMEELQELGITLNEYKKNYESSSLPKNTHFNDNAIELIKNDEWVQYYHTFLSDPKAKSMIENRLKMNEIVEFDNRFGLNNFSVNAVAVGGEKKTTDESSKQKSQGNSQMDIVNHNIISTSSDLLASTLSRASLGSSTNEEQMETQTIQTSKRMKTCSGKEDVVDVHHEGDGFHPQSHSTPINTTDESTSSTHLSVDDLPSPSRQPDDEGNILPPVVSNDNCLPSAISKNCSMQSTSTASSFSIPPVSNNSINKTLNVLNSSSIQLGSTDPTPIIEHHQDHQDKQLEIDGIVGDVLRNVLNTISVQADVNESAALINGTTVKRRGRRRLSKASLPSSITASEITAVVQNSSHQIWKKLILNKHVLASMSDLSRTVTGTDEINAARQSCIEKLLKIGCFVSGDGFLNGKEKAVLKNSPEDPRLVSGLNTYHIDIDEYKQSFNNHQPFGYQNGVPVPAILSINTNKNKFTQSFVDKLQADPFYSMYLRIDPEHVVKSSLKRKTTSSHETDLFRKQKQLKVVKQKNMVGNSKQLVINDPEASINNKQSTRTRRMPSKR